MVLRFLHYLFYGTLGLLLLPAVAGLSRALFHVLVEAQMDPGAGHTLLRFLIGVGAWALVFVFLSRPVRSYVLAHELSHALFAWMMGKRVGRLRVSRAGGSVEVSDTNLLITLAPYLFPFYSVLLIIGFGLAQLFWDLSAWWPWMPFLLGLTWSFHLSFTLLALSHAQSDISAYGALAAYPVIAAGNLLGLLLALLVATPIPFADGCALVWTDLRDAYLWTAARLMDWGFSRLRQ